MTVNEFYKQKFGRKVYKISLDAGCTCPNRDGTKSYSGCIFCGQNGSGDFIPFQENIRLQVENAKKIVEKKIKNGKYIAYFQNFTNTYGDIEILYENNPRLNDEAVEYVKNSIKEFGFKVPIVIDKDNVIIAGHTRIKASKELGIKDIPCIIADDLTEEQVKAFRLADNKVAEKSMWDYSKLDEELDSILDIDMSMFDFNTDEIDWSNVDDLSDETYEEPEKDMLECPHCHHIDSKNHFRKIKSSDDIEKIKVPDFYVRQATLEDIDAIKKIADKNSQQIGFVLRPALEENCKKI